MKYDNLPEMPTPYEFIYAAPTPEDIALYTQAAQFAGGLAMKVFNMRTETDEAVRRLANQKRAAAVEMARLQESGEYGVQPHDVYVDFALREAMQCKESGGAILSVSGDDPRKFAQFSQIVENLRSQQR